MTASWSLSGTYFESCNCDAACPCVFLSEPTEGECTVLVGWHIEDGHADEVALDDLNVALALRSPGHMASVAIDFAADGRRRSLRIGDVGAVEIAAIEGQQGEAVAVTGHPLCIAPGHPAVVARSEQLSYHDHGLDWELSEKNGFFSPFAYRS